jgi:hypothetical protein
MVWWGRTWLSPLTVVVTSGSSGIGFFVFK